MSKEKFYIFNNFIYWTRLGNKPYGHEQGLNRPCLVVRTTKESEVCTIIPITLERLNDKIPYHIDLDNGMGTALVEQIRTIDKRRIYAKVYTKKKHATITDDDRNKLNEQILKLYLIKENFKKDVDKNNV
jgi:mRNA-degrading endonuclease toxin of MazEF toxin-antitoxin module